MEERVLGRIERPVSVIGLGTWQLGADWGEVSETAALAVLSAAVESGVTFFDTADVYGGLQTPDMEKGYGISEQIIGRWLRRSDDPTTFMEVYEGVHDESAFEALLEREAKKLGVARTTERFVCA